uniref:Uncharacterized protein n=1 Tax=Solanum tuberosum TaxID=4113 RepID=M1DYQ2_SOLTU
MIDGGKFYTEFLSTRTLHISSYRESGSAEEIKRRMEEKPCNSMVILDTFKDRIHLFLDVWEKSRLD